VKLVIDASVTLKWLLLGANNEQNLVEAQAVLTSIVTDAAIMIQPPHWLAEVLAVIARLQPQDVQLALATMLDMDVVRPVTGKTYLRAAELSIRLNQHLFDTLYHALALEEGATLITADERYFRAASSEGAIQQLSTYLGA
jgi:predicted nucleic acid-binding protein